MDCGESNIVVLEFDHRDPSTKSFNISDSIRRRLGFKAVEEEMKKCDVVCSNCHRIRTAKQFNHYEGFIRPIPSNKITS